MNFQHQAYETVMDPSMQPNGDTSAAKEDESPTLAFLRAKKGGNGLNSGSNHSVPFVKPEADLGIQEEFGGEDPMLNFHDLANKEGGDAGSFDPFDAFEVDQDLMLTGDDADLVDLALRSPDASNGQSVSTGFHDSVASGLSLENNGGGGFDGGFNDNDGELQRRKEQLRKETLESLNKSMSSLNDAFERLTASMDRTNKTREMLKQFEGRQSNPLDALRKDAAQTGIAPSPSITGVAIGGGRRRRTLSRSSSNNSLNSIGSKGSIGSRGRKSRDKSTRKLKRNVKNDLRTDLRGELARSRSNSRSSLGRGLTRNDSNRSLSGLPDQIILTGVTGV